MHVDVVVVVLDPEPGAAAQTSRNAEGGGGGCLDVAARTVLGLKQPGLVTQLGGNEELVVARSARGGAGHCEAERSYAGAGDRQVLQGSRIVRAHLDAEELEALAGGAHLDVEVDE